MDYLAHGLWSYILFHWMKKPWKAVLFGLLPDTLSWFIYAVYSLFRFESLGNPHLQEIPDWVFILYNISHSMLIAIIAITIVFLILRKFPVYMLTWPIAITMDVFTHTREFLPTPFLWPLSTWKFPGTSWGNGWFMLANYILIISAFIYLFKFQKKKTIRKFAKIYK